jgi:hypothetical protein
MMPVNWSGLLILAALVAFAVGVGVYLAGYGGNCC